MIIFDQELEPPTWQECLALSALVFALAFIAIVL